MTLIQALKVHNVFPKVPSLTTSCGNMASNSEQIMEKSRNFQIIYAGRTKLTFQNKPTDHVRGITKLAATLSHWGQASSRKQSRCGRHGLSNILKLQAMSLYSSYHQRAGKTNLFHMRGGPFHAGNTLCTFKCVAVRQHDNFLYRPIRHKQV